MDGKEHWERVFSTKSDREMSWFQNDPALSLELILETLPAGGRVLDVGGGASTLVDRLLDLGFSRVAVLDVSGAALARAKARLGKRAELVHWVEADVALVEDVGECDVWHDRAAYHFLAVAGDRRNYVRLAERTVRPGGRLVIATFALAGPSECSGLEVRRYDAESLAGELGDKFSLVKQREETHLTPWGSSQAFLYGVFQRRRE